MLRVVTAVLLGLMVVLVVLLTAVEESRVGDGGGLTAATSASASV